MILHGLCEICGNPVHGEEALCDLCASEESYLDHLEGSEFDDPFDDGLSSVISQELQEFDEQ